MKNIYFILFSLSIILISLYLAIDKNNIEGLQVGPDGTTQKSIYEDAALKNENDKPVKKNPMQSDSKLKDQKPDDKTSNKAYNSDNYDITYHADPSAQTNEDDSTAGVGKMWVKDKTGKLISVPYSDVKNTTLYYQTGSYPFGPSSYVPNYEESVLLSKSSNKLASSQIYNLASQKGGFCAATESSVYDREQKCNQQNTNTCASTGCCVLLGGEKCVAGNENGPSLKSNYSDFLITNRDYYYYNGKCYGNCV